MRKTEEPRKVGGERRIRRKRFPLEYIQKSGCDLPPLQRSGKGRFVHRIAPPDVDDYRAMLHPPQKSHIHKIVRAGIGRQHADEPVGISRSHRQLPCISPADAIHLHAERHEAFGISVAEYLVSGNIAIVPDEGGSREVVDSPALSYRTDDEAASILSRLLTDASFREEQRLHCAERAKTFTRQAYIDRQRLLLDSILK